MDQQAHLFERLQANPANLPNLAFDALVAGIFGPMTGSLGKERQAVQSLGDRVVEFPRQPTALGGYGFLHLAHAQCFLNLNALFDFLL